jgi:phenylalanyl-tRNA synthetase beta chain
MIVSVNWLKKFTDVDQTIEDLAARIGARLVEIESTTDLNEKYKDVVIVKVVECGPLEGTDHLNLTKVDDGGIIKDVERDDKGLVQVICGAPNVTAGMLAAWLPPSSTVPETFGDSEPFVLTTKNLRGVMSNGMLASAKELDLYDDHTGILRIDKDVKPGSGFATVYELDDYLLDIENKSLTHRPDAFGMVGFAREVAGISGKQFTTPEFLRNIEPTFENDGSVQAPSVTIDDPALSDRYQVIVLSDARESATAPITTQTFLSRVGVRSINAIVDVTNMLMIATGQPLHAFDYDKVLAIGGGKADIHVRTGNDGETLELLDNRIINLTSEDIVITSGDTPIALAGAMGGASTAIDQNTKNLIIESATFDLYHLRTTQMRHGIFSEAITRFTKGQPPELTAPVLAEAVRLMGEFAGAKAVSSVAEAYPGRKEPITLDISIEKINDVLGTQFSADDVMDTLKHVEFNVELSGAGVSVTVPYWRQDIHIVEDIIEEMGRLNGFDTINLTLPSHDFTAVQPSEFDQLRARIRSLLVRAGANEVLTYSFIHSDILSRSGQKTDDSYRISNAISPNLQYYRQSLTPSLLQLVYPNIKNGYDEFALFELNKVHPKQRGLTEENVPVEVDAISLTIARRKEHIGAPYYQAKYILDFMCDCLGLHFDYIAIDEDISYPTAAPFEYRRSAMVVDVLSGERIGIVGEYKRSVIKAFKLPEYVAGFELDADAVLRATQKVGPLYVPLSRFPSTERDICFQVESPTEYSKIVTIAQDILAGSVPQSVISAVDIYQPEDGKTKNITIRIKLIPTDHTMTSDEANTVIKSVTEAVIVATHATVI